MKQSPHPFGHDPICCVFWPAFRCCTHPKAGRNTFFTRSFCDIFSWFQAWNHCNRFKMNSTQKLVKIHNIKETFIVTIEYPLTWVSAFFIKVQKTLHKLKLVVWICQKCVFLVPITVLQQKRKEKLDLSLHKLGKSLNRRSPLNFRLSCLTKQNKK